MTDYVDTVHDRALATAGDASEADSYWLRPATAGEWCTLCGEPFEVGEIVDVLFITAHLECIDELKAEFGGSHGE